MNKDINVIKHFFYNEVKTTDNLGRTDTNYKIKIPRIVICFFLLVFLLAALTSTFVVIPTGYTGVKTTFGQIDSTPATAGINVKIPFVQKIEKVNNKQQDISFSSKVWSESSERTPVFYENIIVTYSINADKSAWIYANVTDYKSNLITESLVASAIKAASKTLTDADATNRGIIEPLALEYVQNSLNIKYGENILTVNQVVISNADYEESYNNALSARQLAKINAEQQAIENQKAIEKAEADAKVKTTEAQGEADAKLISAQAESEANKLLEKSLTSQILQSQYIEKWDGKLPTYSLGDNTSTLFSVPMQ